MATNGSSARRLLWPTAALIGALAFAASCLLLAPGRHPHQFGAEFAAMAADPFACRGPFPHRILGPLLAWLLGFGREHYWLFAHGTVVLFLATVAATALRRGASLAGAAVLTATIAATGAVEVYKGHVGYPEPASFTLLLAGAALTQRAGWFWFVMFLGLLNHEGIAFYWPWLLWRAWRDNGGVRSADWLAAPLVVGAYLAIRWLIFAHATEPVLSANIYFAGLPTLATTGVWAYAMVSVVVYFGLLPMLWAWHCRVAGFLDAGAPMLLLLGSTFVMCTYATDLPRFIGFLALPTVFAGIHLLQRPRGVVWLAALGGATTIAIVAQRPVVLHLVDAMLRRMPDPFPIVVVDEWPVFAGYAAAITTMVVAGAVLAARRDAAPA